MTDPSPPVDSGPLTRPWFRVVEPDNQRRLARWFSIAVSLAMIAAVAWQVRTLDFSQVAALIPTSALFWAVFVVSYLAGPLGDWIIFRRLWRLPLAGLGALLRKMVTNELLLGYLGDAQFYGWARARLAMVAAPFGAVKDVAILSAVTGNVVTMTMLVFAWPLVASGQIGVAVRDAYISLGVVLVSSFAIFLFRRQLFSLSQRELWFIAGVHVGRIALALAGSALMWHLVLPEVAIGLWIVLATLRMLISRLPLLPNKDIVFAGITVFLLGHETEIAALMAMMAALQLAAHVAIGAIYGALDIFNAEKVK